MQKLAPILVAIIVFCGVFTFYIIRSQMKTTDPCVDRKDGVSLEKCRQAQRFSSAGD